MKRVYTIGLSKIEIGDIALDGDMGSNLEQLGYTYKDTCTMTQEDPEENDFYAEEEDDPVKSISKAGKISFNFSLMNPSPEAMVSLMGGTASKSSQGLTDNDTWNAPNTSVQIEKSVKITPVTGYTISVPRMKIVAKINAEFKKSGIFLVEVAGTVLAPEKNGVSKLSAVAASEAALSVSPTSLSWATAAADSTGKTVTASSTGNVTAASVTEGCDWVTSVTYTGKVVTVKVAANANTDSRSTTLYITADNKTVAVPITQAGA